MVVRKNGILFCPPSFLLVQNFDCSPNGNSYFSPSLGPSPGLGLPRPSLPSRRALPCRLAPLAFPPWGVWWGWPPSSRYMLGFSLYHYQREKPVGLAQAFLLAIAFVLNLAVSLRKSISSIVVSLIPIAPQQDPGPKATSG